MGKWTLKWEELAQATKCCNDDDMCMSQAFIHVYIYDMINVNINCIWSQRYITSVEMHDMMYAWHMSFSDEPSCNWIIYINVYVSINVYMYIVIGSFI